MHCTKIVRSVDIAPTLARLIGVRITEPIDGTAVVEVLRALAAAP